MLSRKTMHCWRIVIGLLPWSNQQIFGWLYCQWSTVAPYLMPSCKVNITCIDFLRYPSKDWISALRQCHEIMQLGITGLFQNWIFTLMTCHDILKLSATVVYSCYNLILVWHMVVYSSLTSVRLDWPWYNIRDEHVTFQLIVDDQQSGCWAHILLTQLNLRYIHHIRNLLVRKNYLMPEI